MVPLQYIVDVLMRCRSRSSDTYQK